MSKSILELHLEIAKEKRLRDRLEEIWNERHGMVYVRAREQVYKGDAVVFNGDGTVSSLREL